MWAGPWFAPDRTIKRTNGSVRRQFSLKNWRTTDVHNPPKGVMSCGHHQNGSFMTNSPPPWPQLPRMTAGMALATNLNKAAMADRMGDRLASRLYAGNPKLPEVAFVINTAEDYRA